MATWVGIVTIWTIYPFGVKTSISHENYHDVWIVACVFCGVTALLRRIGTCKIVLLANSLRVDNPISSQEVAYASVKSVGLSSTGGLSMSTVHGDTIRVFAFGGSLVDKHYGTSDQAASDVGSRLPKSPLPPEKAAPAQKHLIRRCWSSDIFLAAAILAGVVAAFIR
ncbi:hypothetical protein NGB36_18265 [Streptomyces sp. RB6PN25]|uniref:PH domain-containing protein n=1 Tax=Streptomyces humicola TaxID=2953240 RepID=A0ABT1Q177_9ACTN|nr:hypothetical protein [Streptomyces humicola]MCQ4082492.1 hypothetical protein [Streptomyces humicola]